MCSRCDNEYTIEVAFPGPLAIDWGEDTVRATPAGHVRTVSCRVCGCKTRVCLRRQRPKQGIAYRTFQHQPDCRFVVAMTNHDNRAATAADIALLDHLDSRAG